MNTQYRSWLRALSWVYIILIGGWFLAYLAFGDRFGLLALVNALAVYLFLPLPLLIIATIVMRRTKLWVGATGVCLVFIWLWGGLFLPKQQLVSAYTQNDNFLSVMTYNLLGWHSLTQSQIDIILEENTDVVMLQELNYNMAQVVNTILLDEYPYQILAPGQNVEGMGIISKYPISSTGIMITADYWVGDPQAVTLEWRSKRISLVNIHMRPSNSIIPQDFRNTSYSRELQAQLIKDFMQSEEAVIVAGDTNTTSLSDAYKILTSGLIDSWKEAGFGLGHTFPGSLTPGSSRPVLFGIPSPQWMTRIDFIFHSAHWKAVSAHTAFYDHVSDHRGVIVFLDWVE